MDVDGLYFLHSLSSSPFSALSHVHMNIHDALKMVMHILLLANTHAPPHLTSHTLQYVTQQPLSFTNTH